MRVEDHIRLLLWNPSLRCDAIRGDEFLIPNSKDDGQDLLPPSVFRTYSDDVLVWSGHIHKQEFHVIKIFELTSVNKRKLKISNCSFCQEKMDLLGNILRCERVSVDPKNLSEVAGISLPTISPVPPSFMGLYGYYARFYQRLRDVANVSSALHAATSTLREFQRTEEVERALVAINSLMMSPSLLAVLILTNRSWSRPMHLVSRKVPSWLRRRIAERCN